MMNLSFTELINTELKVLWLITYAEFICGLFVFLVLTQTSWKTTYGRYGRESWFATCSIPARVAWFVQELPCLLVPLYVFLFRNCDYLKTGPNLFLLLLLCVHYFQRCLIYPFLIRGGKGTPFHVFILAFCFCLINSYLQVLYHCNYAIYTRQHLCKPTTIIGVILFILGMSINLHSDHILRNLRKPGETGYKIPKGGMFEYVSGANFFGEILEWLGFSIAAWSLPSLAFTVFTVSNIGPRAMSHHRWYLQKFEDYPKKRKALIPFIY